MIPGLGRSPEGGSGNPLQCFLPGKFHWQRSLVGSVHRVTESDKIEHMRAQAHTCTQTCMHTPQEEKLRG